MKTRVSLLLAFAILSQVSYAQTVKWCIHPKYDEISYFGEDLFKCVDQSGNVQLVDWNGKELLHNVDADAVTDFVEGYTIVLQGSKIKGLLAETNGHSFQLVTGDYSITQYPFFSEGLLAVVNGEGKMGYMDAQGKIVIPCKYVEARPFKQGWASVEKKKKEVWYVNPQGREMRPDGFHGGKLTKGSSFNEYGEAVVANYQDYAIIGSKMQVKRKIKYTPELPVRSCDYSYAEKAGGDCYETGVFELEEDNRIESYSKNGVYGYRWNNSGEENGLPAQFNDAQPFFKGRAIVAKNGKYGVLELLEGEFVANWPKDLRVYPDGKSNLLRFSLEVPSSLDSKQVDLEFDEGNGNYEKSTPLSYEFRPNLSHGSNYCTLRGKATCEGLLLWDSSEDIKINRISIDIKRPTVTTEFADENDEQIVRAVVTNESNVSVSVEATLKVAGHTTPFKGMLKPKQSKELFVKVKVTESKQVPASVSVRVDGHACGDETSQVSLKI